MFNKKKLKDMRIDADMTQDQLAELIGVKKKTVSAYETGAAKPGLEVLIKIAEALNISLDYFVDLVDEPMPYKRENYIELPREKTREIKTEMQNYLQLLKLKYKVK